MMDDLKSAGVVGPYFLTETCLTAFLIFGDELSHFLDVSG